MCLHLYLNYSLRAFPTFLSLSLAVVECSGSLAHLHPKAFISRMIPRLKEEILSGETQCAHSHTHTHTHTQTHAVQFNR